jgi:hypothetical protein
LVDSLWDPQVEPVSLDTATGKVDEKFLWTKL